MKKTDRISLLIELVNKAGGSINSKKKLHKMVYLIQQSGIDFDQKFTFHFYGVFSPSLASDLDEAVERGCLIVDDPKGQKLGHKIYINQKQIDSIDSTFNGTIKSLIEKLQECKPQLLEVLSTIVYLDRNLYDNEEIQLKLSELKPKLNKFYAQGFELAHQLYKI